MLTLDKIKKQDHHAEFVYTKLEIMAEGDIDPQAYGSNQDIAKSIKSKLIQVYEQPKQLKSIMFATAFEKIAPKKAIKFILIEFKDRHKGKLSLEDIPVKIGALNFKLSYVEPPFSKHRNKKMDWFRDHFAEHYHCEFGDEDEVKLMI